jgi:hypothetical protein
VINMDFIALGAAVAVIIGLYILAATNNDV